MIAEPADANTAQEDVEQAEAAGDADPDLDREDSDCYRASQATQPGTTHPTPSVPRLPAGTSSELCKFITGELKDALDWTPLKLLRANADIQTLTLRGLHASLIALAGAWWWEAVLGAAVPPVVKAAQSKALAWGASLTRRLVVSDSDLWCDAPYAVSTAELHGLVPEGTMQPRLFVLMLAILGSLWNRQTVGNPCPKRAIVGNVVLSQHKVSTKDADALARRFAKVPVLLSLPVMMLKKTKTHTPLKINANVHVGNSARGLPLGVRNAMGEIPACTSGLTSFLTPEGVRVNWEYAHYLTRFRNEWFGGVPSPFEDEVESGLIHYCCCYDVVVLSL